MDLEALDVRSDLLAKTGHRLSQLEGHGPEQFSLFFGF